MRKIVLISTFCDTEEKQNILSENIDILKNQGIDVMCLSPNFIQLPHNIVEKSDFVFYTKENPLLEYPERAFTWWKTILNRLRMVGIISNKKIKSDSVNLRL
jgi:hypothetical protein